MSRKNRKRSKRVPGLPPGTLNITADQDNQISITVINYNEHQIDIKEITHRNQLKNDNQADTVTWLQVREIHKSHVVRDIGNIYQLHPLILEDILNPGQRPKINVFDDYIFMILKVPAYEAVNNEIAEQQISIILGNGFLITCEEEKAELFQPVHNRLTQQLGRIRRMKADYLAYTILDLVVDIFFTVIETIEEGLESFEEMFTATDTLPDITRDLYQHKQMVIRIRKSIFPVREIIRTLEREESGFIRADTHIFLRDVYEHSIQIIESLETTRESLTTLHDVYLSTISNRMNQVMKVLTIFASIFIPLTFFAGLYGMNFKYMPELQWPWAYPVLLGLMILITGSMLIYFRKKDWIGKSKRKKKNNPREQD